MIDVCFVFTLGKEKSGNRKRCVRMKGKLVCDLQSALSFHRDTQLSWCRFSLDSDQEGRQNIAQLTSYTSRLKVEVSLRQMSFFEQ